MQSVSIIELMLSILLFFVMFFGIGFLLNMLLRASWVMALVYPIVVVLIVYKGSSFDFLTKPGTAFPSVFERFGALHFADIAILASGMAGAIASGFVTRYLRNNGYQMF